MADPLGALPVPLSPSDSAWPQTGQPPPDRSTLLARLAATVGAARAPLLARTLADDLAEAAGWVTGSGRDEFRRGCHALVALAGIAGDAPLEQAARQWLARTEGDGANAALPAPDLRAALSRDAHALVDSLRALAEDAPAPRSGA